MGIVSRASLRGKGFVAGWIPLGIEAASGSAVSAQAKRSQATPLFFFPASPEYEGSVGVLVPARKIPDVVCRREGPCGPPPSEGGYPHEVWVQPPPYRHPGNGIFIRCGETRFMTTWWLIFLLFRGVAGLLYPVCLLLKGVETG